MQNIINFFLGNVQAEVSSEFPERFINICAQNNIALWDIQRVDKLTLRASMRRSGFKKLLPFAGRGIGQIKLVKRGGLPFFLWGLRKRYALAAGVIVTAAALSVLSLYIWEIEVSGCVNLSGEEILQHLSDLGVGVGTYRYSVKSDEIQNKMILQIPELSWLAVNVKGSRAFVEVREKTPKPDIVPEKVPCNVVAKKSGLIIGINTLEGSAQIKSGQPVEQGQLLVSGLVDSKIVGVRQVHAMADVRARTWYEYTSVMPMKAHGKIYTGREKKRHALVIAGLRINFYRNSSQNYAYCDKMVERATLRIGDNMTMPFTWITETLTEYKINDSTISGDSAIAYMKNALGARLHSEVGSGEIISADFSSGAGDGVWKCEMVAECIESIAQTVEIPMN